MQQHLGVLRIAMEYRESRVSWVMGEDIKKWGWKRNKRENVD